MSQAIPIIPREDVDALRTARTIILHESRVLAEIAHRLDGRFLSALALLEKCTGCLVISGVGKAGIIAQKVAATFASTGTRARFLHPTDALHGDLGSLSAQDLVLLLSHSGETEEILRLANCVLELGLHLLAITSHEQSRLAKKVDVTIVYGPLQEAGLFGLPPTSSTTAMIALGDALALVLAERRQFSPQQFHRFHPAGSLGRRLMSVTSLMRQGCDLRIAPDHWTVREVYIHEQRPGRRSGAVILTNESGQLSGIFTDSDLARLLEQRRDHLLDMPISAVMTRHPVTISHRAVVEDALRLLAERRLSELPVIDDHHHPIGLIDITDVIGLLPALSPA